MFQEAESLLCCEEWPAAQQLLGLAAQHLPCICNVRALEDCCYYRLSNSKVRGMCVTVAIGRMKYALLTWPLCIVVHDGTRAALLLQWYSNNAGLHVP
jgi:hypothetical protein